MQITDFADYKTPPSSKRSSIYTYLRAASEGYALSRTTQDIIKDTLRTTKLTPEEAVAIYVYAYNPAVFNAYARNSVSLFTNKVLHDMQEKLLAANASPRYADSAADFITQMDWHLPLYQLQNKVYEQCFTANVRNAMLESLQALYFTKYAEQYAELVQHAMRPSVENLILYTPLQDIPAGDIIASTLPTLAAPQSESWIGRNGEYDTVLQMFVPAGSPVLEIASCVSPTYDKTWLVSSGTIQIFEQQKIPGKKLLLSGVMNV